MTAKEYTTATPRWADDAMRLAVRCGGSKADSEDAVQEALASLWQCHENVTLENGKGFLLSATYRRLMSTFRHRAVQHAYAASERAAGLQSQPPDEGFDLREAIERALEVLPEVQRAILQLRDVEGYSYREIGETLDISDDRVQVYLFRARVAMRRQLINMGYGDNR